MKKIILVVALMLIAAPVNAEWWDFTWENPTQREDNSAYDHSTEGGNTVVYNSVDATIRATLLPSVTNYSENFPPGCYGIALTAKDADGRESVWTPLQEWCVAANPKPHTNFTAIRRAQQ